MKGKCKICGWVGFIHEHHIIRVSDNGANTPNNLIQLCPNHHSETLGKEEEFAKKHNLEGEEMSKDKLEALEKASNIYMKCYFNGISINEILDFVLIIKKYGFTQDRLIGIHLNLSENAIKRYRGIR
ncbi:hypothetical protein LCGC14_2256860 [marine sediment metagenome]|uniref:HNH domain-containing protein n=1 Tax=marine sediment metagenome TaxID=412755 RepID=A0A0F9D0S6_9ZZZZ